MKRFVFTVAIAMLAIHSQAPVVLTIAPIGNGDYQIFAPGNSTPAVVTFCVLQASTNLVTWTSVSTNIFPPAGYGDGVTNIVQATNAMAFYRVYTHH
jgi:hypothetical protein